MMNGMDDGGGNENDNKTLIPRQHKMSVDIQRVLYAICRKQSIETVKKR